MSEIALNTTQELIYHLRVGAKPDCCCYTCRAADRLISLSAENDALLELSEDILAAAARDVHDASAAEIEATTGIEFAGFDELDRVSQMREINSARRYVKAYLSLVRNKLTQKDASSRNLND